MKLAISTLGCPEWNFMKILTEFSICGVKGLEVRGLDGEMEADKISWFMPENMAETQKLMKRFGLEWVGFGTSANFHDEKSCANNIATAKRAIDVCQRMGIPAIRVFGDQIKEPDQRDAIIQRVIAALQELSDYGAAKGVGVNLEIHGNFNSVEVIEPIVKALKNNKAFGILWDVQHSDKVCGDDFMPFYQLIKPKLKHVHIKDHKRGEDGQFKLCMVGEGDIPLEKIIKQLLDDKYKGFFSLEWEKKWHPDLAEPDVVFPAFVSFMKRLQAKKTGR
ncbi:MAG: sugar phosphate isomerase/epimerase [Lentisphaerae bacterium]|nr:sugar phosphate isomerase/epimerase [Lentisphaerota bacterium]